MATAASDTARALLDAHVAWTLARLEGPELEAEIARLIDQTLDDMSRLKLKSVVSPKAIHQTVRKYAVEMPLGGAVPELVGDIARAIYHHQVHAQTTLSDLMPDKTFEEFLDKILEMKALRETLVQASVDSPIFSDLITELLATTLRDYAATTERMADRIPGAKSALKFGKAMAARSRPELGAKLEENLRGFVNRSTQASLKASNRFLLEAFESDEFREIVRDIWQANKHHSIADIRDFAGSLDIEELFVIGYEYWRVLRKTPFFTAVVNAGIDEFFAKYGDQDLASIIAEIGVTREMMLDDGLRFAPPLIKALKKHKLLEPLLRRQLEGFYQSPVVQEILAAR